MKDRPLKKKKKCAELSQSVVESARFSKSGWTVLVKKAADPANREIYVSQHKATEF